MVMRRLSSVGLLAHEDNKVPEVIPAFLDRKARLVYEGTFDSMDGPVKVTRAHLEALAKKHNSRLSKLRRLASGELPLSSNPAIQLDHSRSAQVTVGRLNGELSLEDFETPEGAKVLSLVSHLRILGRENVEKVLDGRWSELSIGADFDQSKLEELSFTPFPAAKGSSLLSRLRAGDRVFEDSNGGKWSVTVDVDPATSLYEAKIEGRSLGKFASEAAAQEAAEAELQELFKKSVKLGSGEMFKRLESRLRSYLKLKKKMSDEEADKEMKKLEAEENEEELKKLAKEMDDEEKKDKDEEEKKKTEKLTAAKTKIKQLSTDFRANAERTRLAARVASISHRLSGLRSSGKVTPAEIKKINLEELAGKGDEAITTLMKSYEERQPVIMVGVFGSMKALSHAQLEEVSKTKRLRALEIERYQNIPSFMAHLSEEEKEAIKKEQGSPDEVNIHIDTDPHTDLAAMEGEYTDVCKMMDEGKIAEVKERLKTWMGRMGAGGDYAKPEPTMHETSGAKLAALESELVQLQKSFDEAVSLAESLATGS